MALNRIDDSKQSQTAHASEGDSKSHPFKSPTHHYEYFSDKVFTEDSYKDPLMYFRYLCATFRNIAVKIDDPLSEDDQHIRELNETIQQLIKFENLDFFSKLKEQIKALRERVYNQQLLFLAKKGFLVRGTERQYFETELESPQKFKLLEELLFVAKKIEGKMDKIEKIVKNEINEVQKTAGKKLSKLKAFVANELVEYIELNKKNNEKYEQLLDLKDGLDHLIALLNMDDMQGLEQFNFIVVLSEEKLSALFGNDPQFSQLRDLLSNLFSDFPVLEEMQEEYNRHTDALLEEISNFEKTILNKMDSELEDLEKKANSEIDDLEKKEELKLLINSLKNKKEKFGRLLNSLLDIIKELQIHKNAYKNWIALHQIETKLCALIPESDYFFDKLKPLAKKTSPGIRIIIQIEELEIEIALNDEKLKILYEQLNKTNHSQNTINNPTQLQLIKLIEELENEIAGKIKLFNSLMERYREITGIIFKPLQRTDLTSPVIDLTEQPTSATKELKGSSALPVLAPLAQAPRADTRNKKPLDSKLSSQSKGNPPQLAPIAQPTRADTRDKKPSKNNLTSLQSRTPIQLAPLRPEPKLQADKKTSTKKSVLSHSVTNDFSTPKTSTAERIGRTNPSAYVAIF